MNLVEVVATGVASKYGVGVWCIFIIVVALFTYRNFKLKLKSPDEQLNEALARLKQTKDAKNFAENFYELSDSFKDSELLKEAWHSFSETLIIPDTGLDANLATIKSTAISSSFFSRYALLHSNINLRFYGSFPNVLTGLGILGTFVGLVAGIYLASGGIGGQISEAKTALESLLGGAALAFWTSIFGIASSIIFSWAEHREVHKFEICLSEWNEELDKRLDRITYESIAREQLKESKKQTSVFESFSNDLAFQIAQAIEQNVMEPMSPVFGQLQNTLSEIQGNQANTNEAMLNGIVGKFQESINGAAGEEMKALAETIKSLNEDFKTSVTQLTNAVKDVAQITVGTQNLVQEVQTLLVDAKDAYEKLQNIIEPLDNISKEFSATSSMIVNTSKYIMEVNQHIDASVNNLVGNQEKLKNIWQDYQARFEGVDNSLGGTFEKIDGALSSYTGSMNEYIKSLDDHTSSIVNQLAGAISELQDTVETLSDKQTDMN